MTKNVKGDVLSHISGENLKDYQVSIPFGLGEVMARIKANLRREKRSPYINTENKQIKYLLGNLRLEFL